MLAATAHRYLIALGSNQRHPRHGAPREIVAAALERLADEGVGVLRAAPVIETDPVGPSGRRFANSAALIASDLDPPELLALLKRTEREFGRRAGGQRWRARVIDLDIVLWSGGPWGARDLTIPHPLFRQRSFVLTPAALVAPYWRDPLSGFTLRQLQSRLTRPRALPRCPAWSGP
jgi:2-amino-4-hydroxy-6-hydroxymethyldihydropteridine diphosphokinase